jgi:hypothetical protein
VETLETRGTRATENELNNIYTEQGKKEQVLIMNRYMIETPHKAEECHSIIEDVKLAGYLHHFDWGCATGVHCGWAIVEAMSLEHARQMVPWAVRDRARIVQVEKFDVDTSPHTM